MKSIEIEFTKEDVVYSKIGQALIPAQRVEFATRQIFEFIEEHGEIYGVIQWKTSIGGSANDAGYSISKTSDYGYIIAGLTQSSYGDIIKPNKGFNDIFVIKLDHYGNILDK